MPYLRAGFSDGGGAVWEKTVCAGVGYNLNKKGDMAAVGLSWGKPSEKKYGADLKDPYTTELFYRFNITDNITLTPDVQVLFNPANNPDKKTIPVFGLRARVTF